MKAKKALFGIFIASIFALIFGGRSYATAGNTAEISGGKTWNICVAAGASYDGSVSVVNITKSDFATQLALNNDDCKEVTLAAGSYTASLSGAIGAGETSYEISDDTLTFSANGGVRKYINVFGSIDYTIEGSGEESPFELLFSMPGECQLNGNANVSGATCMDGDGNPLTNKKYIDTGVALFSEENAGRDFEVYFTLSDYMSTQEKQGTLFNAKYENSSMYYPGFTIRTVGTDGETMEITGRLGKDNTNADKANNGITTADIKNKEVKIVRVGGMVSYSIDGGELIPFQNYKTFTRFFNQTAVFGASMQTNGTPQRYYNGTIKNIRIYLKKQTTASIVFDANGGTGTMAKIDNIAVGTDVTLPANAFTLQNATFDGWNTKVDGTGTAYADGATVTVSEVGDLKLYAQWDGRAILDEGSTVNVKLKILAGAESSTSTSTVDNKIKAIKTADALPDGFDTSNSKYVISAAKSISPVPIYAWFDNTDGVIYIHTKADAVDGGESMGVMFRDMRSLSGISALSSWNTSNVTSMGGMFYETSVSDISALASWDTSSVMNMSGIFQYATSLSNISALASWDTSSVTNMSGMFWGASSLSDISALASWNTSSVIYMDNMFYNTRITDVNALETKQYESKDYISWDVSNVTSMYCIFSGVSSLSDISALASWNTSEVTGMYGMFSKTAITNVNALETKKYSGKDYISWNTSKVTDMGYMFSGASSLSNISALASWNTSKVTSMDYMFSGTAITNVDALETKKYSGKDYISWNTSKVMGMGYMFSGASSLSNISALASWNTSNVTYMDSMFRGTAITNVDALRTKQYSGKNYISWDVSNVQDIGYMFYGDYSLTDVSALESWDTSKVSYMYYAFRNVPARPLPSWYQ